MKIISVVGARPNFMKIGPFIRAIEVHNREYPNEGVEHILVHTGQHYDESMSGAFFEDLGIPHPDINLNVGSGTHAEQVGQTMIAFEKVLKDEKPGWVVVVGDVNATLACSVTAKKEWIKVCHIEAGLRSGDLKMPEEINRLVTDRISDLLLAPDMLSVENLRAEGVPESKIRFVGNIMIDTLEANRSGAGSLDVSQIIIRYAASVYHTKKSISGSLSKGSSFAVLTLHRPSNVDTREILEPIVDFLINEVAGDQAILWPVHPRTLKNLVSFGLYDRIASNHSIILLEPLGYLEMLKLNMEARLILTDSGGLQEECTVLGTPCLTLRSNTERPVTLREHGGASVLVGNDINRIREAYRSALKLSRNPVRPELWDGQTAGRCLKAILEY